MHKQNLKNNIRISNFEDLLNGGVDHEMDEVTNMPLINLYTFKDHPFKVVDDEKMQELVESIKEEGVLSPAIVRKREKGGYEIISGHRRKRACEIAGLKSMPVIIKDLDDDEATILMVDANIQRDGILPSERAFSLQLKMKALKNQGKRTDLTSGQVVQKLAADEIGKEEDMSGRQVRRYISLTNLLPGLLEMVDQGKIGLVPAVNISFIGREEQGWILREIQKTHGRLSLRQAEELRKAFKDNMLTEDEVIWIVTGGNKTRRTITFTSKDLNPFFDEELDKDTVKGIILELIKKWKEESQDG